MDGETVLQVIDQQAWLDPAADALQQGVHAAFEAGGEAGQQVKDALHGVWLGHPVHAVITDVPVGAWTAGLVLDALDQMSGRREFAAGADGAITLGLAAAVVAAVTGLTDWSETYGRARKVGLLHGVLNLTAAGLYGASLIYRSKHQRGVGRGLASLGYAIAFGSAWLGGELVYKEQVGIDHTAGGAAAPGDWTAVLPDDHLEDHKPERVDANGFPVMLLRREGRIHALAATCPHAGGPLDEGQISGDTVTCPWHGSSFDLNTGAVERGPSCYDAPLFEARVNDGQIEVRLARRK